VFLIGACEDGTKELIAALDGYQESKLSWMELPSSLKTGALRKDRSSPLVMEDSDSGPLSERYIPIPGNNAAGFIKLPTFSIRCPEAYTRAKEKIHDIYRAGTKEEALVGLNGFISLYGKKFPGTCEYLTKDRNVLFTYYDFPAEHWIRIRTTNPIESTFATVRLRTQKTRGCVWTAGYAGKRSRHQLLAITPPTINRT
jgi:hypothetical protein